MLNKQFLLIVGFVILAFATVACSAGTSSGMQVAGSIGVRAWLDQPFTGAGLPLAPYTLKAHARDTSRAGVQRIAFLVNTVALGSVDTDPTLPLVYAEFGWNPSVEGTYQIQAQAFDATGSSLSEIAVVCVGSNCSVSSSPTPGQSLPPSITPTQVVLPSEHPTATRTSTPKVVTPTRTSTRRVPSPTPVIPTRTATTAPQKGCTGTPNIGSFGASPATITAGGSSTLSWGAVTNADSVSIDHGVGGVPAPGSHTVSPSGTTIYTMTAHCGNSIATKQATVMVTSAPPPPPPPPPPQDKTPPAISGIKPNSSTLTDQPNCTYPTSLIVTASVTDASGIASVQLYYRFGTTGNWSSVTMNSIGGSSYSGTANVGSQFKASGTIQYYVTGRDNAGNSTNSSTLSVSFVLCPS